LVAVGSEGGGKRVDLGSRLCFSSRPIYIVSLSSIVLTTEVLFMCPRVRRRGTTPHHVAPSKATHFSKRPNCGTAFSSICHKTAKP
jgi:hypothetical protein